MLMLGCKELIPLTYLKFIFNSLSDHENFDSCNFDGKPSHG